jgi:hypothetical protein
MVVAAKNDPAPTRIARLTAHDGVIVATQEEHSRWVYTLRNADATSRTLIIEHPVKDGWTVDANPAAIETTAGLVRFKMSLGARREATFIVTERRPGETRVSVGELDDARVLSLVQRGAPDAELRRVVQPVMSKRSEVAAVLSRLASVDAQLNEIASDEQRLRENIRRSARRKTTGRSISGTRGRSTPTRIG